MNIVSTIKRWLHITDPTIVYRTDHTYDAAMRRVEELARRQEALRDELRAIDHAQGLHHD